MVRPLRWLTFGAALAGCGFEISFSSDARPGGNTPDGVTDGPDDPDARLIDAPMFDAAPLPLLVDRGLVVRYFLDDAASGQAPAMIEDSATQPMPLSIDYDTAMTFTEVGGNRGLAWSASQVAGKIEAQLAGKLLTRLTNSPDVTIEVVVQIDASGASGSESHITGMRGGNPDFVLAAFNTTDLRFFRPFGSTGATWLGANTQQRMVLHLVYDATLSNPTQRIELFRNGVNIPKNSGSAPSMNQEVSLVSSDDFMIGNSQSGNRSIGGVIFYVAYYDVALTPIEITSNSTRLLANDDE